jgi:hypothetical protein
MAEFLLQSKKHKKMKNKLFNPIALACCSLILMAVLADLNGKWTGTITTPDGNDLEVTYNFKVSGDTLTGTAESPAGVVTIDNGKVSGDTFSFKVTVDGNDYPHTGKVYNDSCGLDIDFGSQIVHTTLKRATAAN